MVPTLFRLLASQPTWLAGQAKDFANRVVAQASAVSDRWKARALLQLAALCCAMVAATLTGVSALLAVLAPRIDATAAAVLLTTPVLPMLVGVCCWVAAKRMATKRRVEPPPEPPRTTVPLAQIGNLALGPVAAKHPWALVLGAAAVGGLLAWSRPRRWS